MIPGSGRSSGEGIGCPLQYSWASFVAQLVKNLPAMWETWVLIPGLERSPEEGKGYPLQYPGLENCMDCIVHGVAKSRTRLSNFHFHINIYQIDDPTTEKQREVYQTHCNLLYMKNNQKENRLMPMYSWLKFLYTETNIRNWLYSNAK